MRRCVVLARTFVAPPTPPTNSNVVSSRTSACLVGGVLLLSNCLRKNMASPPSLKRSDSLEIAKQLSRQLSQGTNEKNNEDALSPENPTEIQEFTGNIDALPREDQTKIQELTESVDALSPEDLEKIQKLTESVFSIKSENNPNNWHAVYITVPEGWEPVEFILGCKDNYKHILGSSQLSPGENLSWPQRGWSNETEFVQEIEHGLKVNRRGLIARGQTLAAANALVVALNNGHIKAESVCIAHPDTAIAKRSGWDNDEDNRFESDLTVNTEEGGEKTFTVVVELPPGVTSNPETGPKWFQENLSKFPPLLRSGDLKALGSRPFGWNHRGWDGQEQFTAVCMATAVKSNAAVIARQQTKRGADVLVERLRSIGYDTAKVYPKGHTAMIELQKSIELGTMAHRDVSSAGGSASSLSKLAGAMGGGKNAGKGKFALLDTVKMMDEEELRRTPPTGRGRGQVDRARQEGYLGKVGVVASQDDDGDVNVHFKAGDTYICLPQSVCTRIGADESSEELKNFVWMESQPLYGRLKSRNDISGGRRHKVTMQGKRYIMEQPMVFGMLIPAVACGGETGAIKCWHKLEQEVIPGLVASGWNVGNAIVDLRKGERNLEKLTRNLDDNETCVIEHSWHCIKEMESVGALFNPGPRMREMIYRNPETSRVLRRLAEMISQFTDKRKTRTLSELPEDDSEYLQRWVEEKENRGWEVRDAIHQMLRGGRDLRTLTNYVDVRSAILVDHLLKQVLEHDQKKQLLRDVEPHETLSRSEEQKALDIYRGMQRGTIKQVLNRARITVCGQGRVGKSSTIRSLFGYPFLQMSDLTHVAQVFQVNVDTERGWFESEHASYAKDALAIHIARQLIATQGVSTHHQIDVHDSSDQEPINNTNARSQEEPANTADDDARPQEEPANTADEEAFFGELSVDELLKACDGIDPEVVKELSTPLFTPAKEVNAPVLSTEEEVVQAPALSTQSLPRVLNERIKHYVDSPSKPMAYSVWDMGGQGFFHSGHHLFLSEQSVYVCVFKMTDILDPDKVQGALNELEFWLNAIKMHASEASLILVGTCKDVYPSHTQRESFKKISKALERKFKKHKLLKHAKKYQGHVFFPIDNTRSKTDPVISDLQRAINDKVGEQEYFNEEVPLSWFKVGDELANRTKKDQMLPLTDVHQIMVDCGVEKEQFDELLRRFHALGFILYWENLPDFVILHPQWLIDAFAAMIAYEPGEDSSTNAPRQRPLAKLEASDERIDGVEGRHHYEAYVNHCILSSGLLKYLWREKNKEYVEEKTKVFLLKVMHEAALICPIAKDASSKNPLNFREIKSFIVPSCIHKNQTPSDPPKEDKAYTFFFDFSSFYPIGVFEMLICEAVGIAAAFTDVDVEDFMQIVNGNDLISVHSKNCVELDFHDKGSVMLIRDSKRSGRIIVNIVKAMEEKVDNFFVSDIRQRLIHSMNWICDQLNNKSKEEQGDTGETGEHLGFEIILQSYHENEATSGTNEMYLRDLQSMEKVPAGFEGWFKTADSRSDQGLTQSTARGQDSGPGSDRWDFFLSHQQKYSADLVAGLFQNLRTAGMTAWFDMNEEPTIDGMEEGVLHSKAVILVLSPEVFSRPAVQFELRLAMAYNKRICFYFETESRRLAYVDIGSCISNMPPEFKDILVEENGIQIIRDRHYIDVHMDKFRLKLNELNPPSPGGRTAYYHEPVDREKAENAAAIARREYKAYCRGENSSAPTASISDAQPHAPAASAPVAQPPVTSSPSPNNTELLKSLESIGELVVKSLREIASPKKTGTFQNFDKSYIELNKIGEIMNADEGDFENVSAIFLKLKRFGYSTIGELRESGENAEEEDRKSILDIIEKPVHRRKMEKFFKTHEESDEGTVQPNAEIIEMPPETNGSMV